MTTSVFHQERTAIAAQIKQANEKISALEGQIREVDNELQGLFAQRQQYQLLNDICESLDKLETLGAGHLFWGQEPASENAKQRVGQAREQAGQFLQKIAGIEQHRKQLEEGIDSQLLNIDGFKYELAELDKEEEKKLSEFPIERDISKLPYHAMVMPWDPEGEDAKRYRKILLIALLITFSLGSGMAIWKLPPVDKYAPVKIPDRVVNFVKPNLPPPPKKAPPKPPEKDNKPEDNKPEDLKKPTEPKPPTEKPTPEQIQIARQNAHNSGVMKFSNAIKDIKNIMDDSDVALGADASVKGSGSAGNQGYAAGGVGNGAPGTRSLIAAQGGAGSSGISNYNVSRGGVGRGGGGGGAIAGGGMNVAQVHSAIGDMKGKDSTPISKGAGPSRTDEEIQIVFDRYKSALYRIYNRELRNDPTLRGKMVLSLVIEPDGRVSSCKVQSTDLNSPTLSSGIVQKVLTFNFGPKAGVPATKILYPIDFLPAS